MRTLLDLLLHRYIRTGDTVFLYSADGSMRGQYRVTVEGWGKYAAVRVGIGAIRRDCIRWKGGRWSYQYGE